MNLYINTRTELQIMPLDDIAYIKADGNYTYIYFMNGKKCTQLICLSTLESIITQAYKRNNTISSFVRMGRSYLINRTHVASVNCRTLAISFRNNSVQSINCHKQGVKKLRDSLIEYYNISVESTSVG